MFVTGVQTCALPILSFGDGNDASFLVDGLRLGAAAEHVAAVAKNRKMRFRNISENLLAVFVEHVEVERRAARAPDGLPVVAVAKVAQAYPVVFEVSKFLESVNRLIKPLITF